MIPSAENEMIRLLQEAQGITILGIEVTPRSESIIHVSRDGGHMKIPCLSLLLGEDDYSRLQSAGAIAFNGVLQANFRTAVLSAWQQTVRETKLPAAEYYDDDMQLTALNLHRQYYEAFARSRKEQVRQYLINALGKAPRNIYASSLPALNIVYETADYGALGIENRKSKLEEDICALAAEYVRNQYGPDIPCPFSVKIWHPGMEGYNGYGMARED